MITREILIPHHGRTVHGVFRLPEGQGPFPAVLFSHGYGGSLRDFDGDAAYLAERGVASLAYDFCGGGLRDTSGFPTASMTLFTEKEDALAALERLRAMEEVDTRNVFLFGGSLGGLVTVMAAAERPAGIPGLILLFPALCVPDDWRRRFPNPGAVPETIDFWGMTLGRPFVTTLQDLDIFSALPSLAMPTLLFHGDRDPVVPLACSERAVKLMPHASLTVFPGEVHGFSEAGCRQVMEQTAAFVAAHVRGRADPE